MPLSAPKLGVYSRSDPPWPSVSSLSWALLASLHVVGIVLSLPPYWRFLQEAWLNVSTNANFGWDPTTQKISNVDLALNLCYMFPALYCHMMLFVWFIWMDVRAHVSGPCKHGWKWWMAFFQAVYLGVGMWWFPSAPLKHSTYPNLCAPCTSIMS
jgi:hypothetical protein